MGGTECVKITQMLPLQTYLYEMQKEKKFSTIFIYTFNIQRNISFLVAGESRTHGSNGRST